jgi:uncharacterized damage-inducible protein DinB
MQPSTQSAPEQNPGAIFLRASSEKLQKMASAIHTCFDKLDNEQVWRRNSPVENSLGNLVLHLCGNARQWIGSYVGGLDDIRNRPQEFAEREQISSEALLQQLDQTVELAVRVIQEVDPKRLVERVPVQDGQYCSVLQAIYHVVGHFQQHTGQIIFVTKLWTSQDLGLYQPPPSKN